MLNLSISFAYAQESNQEDKSKIYFNTAVGKYKAGDYNAAMDFFDKVIELNKNDTLAYYYGLIAASKAKNCEKIYKYSYALINSFNKLEVFIYQSLLSYYCDCSKDFESALKTAKIMRELFPGNKDVIVGETNIYLSFNKTNEAILLLEKLIQNEPFNDMYYFALGAVYESIDKQKSVTNYEKALEINPYNYDALYNLGAYYFNLGADLHPKYIEDNTSSSGKENYFLMMTNLDKAYQYFERCIQLKPEDPSSTEFLAPNKIRIEKFRTDPLYKEFQAREKQEVEKKQTEFKTSIAEIRNDKTINEEDKERIEKTMISVNDYKNSSMDKKQIDVDLEIPQTNDQKNNVYALIIGNEDYSSFQQGLNSEANVSFAKNDALTFKEYLIKTVGVPEKNINLRLNATSATIMQSIGWINKLAKVTGGKSELIFYYAGHGLPDEKTKEPYIIPVDVTGASLEYGGIKLKDVYAKLTEFPTQKVTVFIDACFSGGSRNVGLVSTRGVKINPKIETLSGNIVVFTASSAEESALPYSDKRHGMFTYFILKKLKDSKGGCTYKELYDFIHENLPVESVLINNKEQTPQILVSPSIEKTWANWKIK